MYSSAPDQSVGFGFLTIHIAEELFFLVSVAYCYLYLVRLAHCTSEMNTMKSHRELFWDFAPYCVIAFQLSDNV